MSVVFRSAGSSIADNQEGVTNDVFGEVVNLLAMDSISHCDTNGVQSERVVGQRTVMSPRVQDHASVTVHGEVKGHAVKVLLDDITNDSGFNFGESTAASECIGAGIVAGADGIESKVVVPITVNSWAEVAERVLVSGTGLAPEAVLEKMETYFIDV